MRSLAMMGLLTFVLAGVACGKVNGEPAPEELDGIRSGTRLKARWNSFDGTKVFAGLLDSTRNEMCSVRRFTDTKSYCVPSKSGPVVYRDNACTMPIGRQPRTTCPVTTVDYFVETDPMTCDGSAVKVYARGAQISLPTYYIKSATACAGFTPTSSDLFLLGAEVPITELAMFEEPALVTSGRVQQRLQESLDGAQVQAGIYDSELGADCSMVLDASRTSATCLPTASSTGAFFADATCTAPKTTFRKGCTPPKFATRFEAPNCSGVAPLPTLYSYGAQNSTALFSIAPATGMCAAATAAADLSYYELGAAVTMASVPRAPEPTGTGRYRPIYTSSADAKLREPMLLDTLKQTECTISTLGDGSVRCLPLITYATSLYYGDAACTTELFLVFPLKMPVAGCAAPPLPKYTIRAAPAPAAACTLEVRPVGEPYTGPLFSKNTAGACTAVSFPNFAPRMLGAPAPLEDFPAAAVVTDP